MIDPNTDIAEFYKKKKQESITHRVGDIVAVLSELLYLTDKEEAKEVLIKIKHMINTLMEEL